MTEDIRTLSKWLNEESTAPIDRQALARVLAIAQQAQVPALHTDGWLQSGGLLYRLTDERRPQNRDEINVTMADGSRSDESRTRRAGELLDRIRSAPQPKGHP